MWAKLKGFCLENEECKEKASVSDGQAGELTADEWTTKEVSLTPPIAAERIENDSSRVGNYRGDLDAILATGQ